MKRITAVLCALLLAACSSPTDLPDSSPAANGSIITLTATTVHIRAASEQCGVVFRVTDDTRILQQHADGSPSVTTMSQLVAGRRAIGWADGPIAESCPAQAEADVILQLNEI